MELPGHADSFHDDVWPQELGGRSGDGGGVGGSAVLDLRLVGAGRVWSLGVSTL